MILAKTGSRRLRNPASRTKTPSPAVITQVNMFRDDSASLAVAVDSSVNVELPPPFIAAGENRQT
jgi:hypothetical protein